MIISIINYVQKMTLIEGIGDEVIQFFVALLFILIVALAWCTTNISNEGNLRTVFLLERRRLRASRRLTIHSESATIVEGTTEEDLDSSQTPPVMEEDKPSESSSTSQAGVQSSTEVLQEESRIVEAMDAQGDEQSLRRRRLAFYNRNTEDNTRYQSPNSAPQQCNESLNQSTNIENEAECLAEEKKSDSSKSEGKTDSEEKDRICVKLMYLNDELRHVDGRLQEKLGDFKRRHFQVELAANKLVKLIFNGHVLQQDGDTLQSCGMFDNCVVHCLVHQRTNTSSQRGNTGSRDSSSTPLGMNSHTNNNNQPHEWHLENYLFMILCCFLGFAWYLRYVYAHLYTVTATIGLILMTGIFTIIMFGMHFPDNTEINQQRTENIQSHQ
ncbi:hypothetical protein HHI36_017645 [Cryptolaemus montrouzieri]|uniref:Ubiquitin-like domain-containing protein n=1 Tax=Cryptolaemus montrouzieri TaxID=559131 RepID=A0ABD2NPP1_9CUCU